MKTTECSGCGLRLPAHGGPTHAYVTSSPECWALFSEHLPRQAERLFPDAYMAQHPDGNDRRQVQSVASHLVALEAVLVRGQPRTKVADIVVAAVGLGRELGGFRILNRPSNWPSTIADVIEGRVEGTDFVEDVLSTWHETEGEQLKEWTDETLKRLYS